MTLNISKGNMYPFVTHTWNTIKGKCPHDCSYCFMKRFGEQKPMRFDKKELKADLGEGNFIFVGSSCDMWADDVKYDWIVETNAHLKSFKNTYLLQTKNPKRLSDFRQHLPQNTVAGTTIETNRVYPQMGNTPHPNERGKYIFILGIIFRAMVTIEPIMDFDLEPMSNLIKNIEPGWVNIGADSQGHNLPEPSSEKIQALIDNLREGDIEVKLKSNLKRLMK